MEFYFFYRKNRRVTKYILTITLTQISRKTNTSNFHPEGLVLLPYVGNTNVHDRQSVGLLRFYLKHSFPPWAVSHLKKRKWNIMKYKPRALSCRVGVGKCFKCSRIEAVTWHPSSVTLYLNFFLLFAPSQSPLNVVRRMALSLLFDLASR